MLRGVDRLFERLQQDPEAAVTQGASHQHLDRVDVGEPGLHADAPREQALRELDRALFVEVDDTKSGKVSQASTSQSVALAWNDPGRRADAHRHGGAGATNGLPS